jgi:hypothetical protein
VGVRATVLGLAALGLAALLAGCGGGSSSSTSSSSSPTATGPPPLPPRPTTTTTPVQIPTTIHAVVKPGASAKEYARRVDAIVADSKSNLEGMQMYIGLVTTDQLPPDESLSVVRSTLQDQQGDLEQARALTLPPAFKQAQLLLEQTLQLRVDEQQEFLVSAKKRYNDPLAGWAASFNRAASIGRQAHANATKFVAVYGVARQKALGDAPSSLPPNF